MGNGDRTTVAIRDGVDPEGMGLPALPVDIGKIDIGGHEVLGAVEVENVGSDGVWSLEMGISLPDQKIRAADVSERLAEGTYAIVRVGGDTETVQVELTPGQVRSLLSYVSVPAESDDEEMTERLEAAVSELRQVLGE